MEKMNACFAKIQTSLWCFWMAFFFALAMGLWIDMFGIFVRSIESRVIYDRVVNRKNYFEIPIFLSIECGISKAGKFKVTLYFLVTEMCLCFYLNSRNVGLRPTFSRPLGVQDSWECLPLILCTHCTRNKCQNGDTYCFVSDRE